ncbi:hypothetical protein G7Y89_g2020 [Cudoniella acicularis]|uniref:Uncharacterized protein n=1 Tax=Cudoniella acicularis TaxID=354080 RepID=A0A8H4W909_9HELO|nr:hypothetical protein G7Y89_g2020 [Cudoniella acicularis]
MNNNLVTYVSAFERWEPAKNYFKNTYCNPSHDIRRFGMSFPARAFGDSHSRCHLERTALSWSTAPIYIKLGAARDSAGCNDLLGFKKRRHQVLEAMKPRYEHITEASARIFQYVKRTKTEDGILGIYHRQYLWHGDRIDILEGMSLLEDYLASL